MMYANIGKEKSEALPGLKAICPACEKPVIAKCGEIKVWHWAHENICPFDREEETAWHIGWKRRFPRECIEIKDANHRADVIHKGTVYEFQSKPLPPEEERNRRGFWNLRGYRMIWIFNMTEVRDHFNLRNYETEDAYSFRWKWPRQMLSHIPFPFVFDFDAYRSNEIFVVKKIHWGGKVGGWGYHKSVNQFFSL